MADRLGVIVEGCVPLPNEYPALGELVSAKLTAEITSTESLPIRRNLLAVKGYLNAALTYSADTTPHSLLYLKLRLPFVNYIPHLSPDDYSAKVLYYMLEPQHSRSLYYSAALELERGR